jgi:large subunit ribosomal protein L21
MENGSNMYAIVRTGGKQYRVSEGDTLRVEKLAEGPGDTIELTDVGLVEKDGTVQTGEALQGAKVVARVTGEGKRKKIRVFKYKRRKQYHRTQGHRQQYTQIQITNIVA